MTVALASAELGRDVAGPPARGGQAGDVASRRGAVDRDGDGRRAVLVAGGVDDRGELVHLEEGARGLGDPHAHALAARGVAVDELVLDRVVEDRGERVDQLADRGRRQRPQATPVAVAQVGAGGERVADLGRLLELVALEREAELGGRSGRGGYAAKYGSR